MSGTYQGIETMNDHLVGVQNDMITMVLPPLAPMTKDEALRMAAWLVACADPLGERFRATLDKILNT